MGFPGGSDGKESVYNVRDPASLPGWGRSPGGGNGYPSVFLPGKFHGQSSLADYTVHGAAKGRMWLALSLFLFV